VGRPEDRAIMTAALPFVAPVKLLLVPDAHVALAGALGGQPGAVVISGTGSIAYGVDAAGRTARAGGWGWILGDEGSGYDIGRRAIMAALAAEDGTGPGTGLGLAICRAWALERVEQVVPAVYGDLVAAKPRIASLVPVVIAAASAGDTVAAGLLAGAGRDLGALAAAVMGRLALPEPLVAVTGGVLSGSAPVRAAMAAALGALAPGARLVESAGTPADGAVWLARQL
jgi:N-acetylglucosamine kinase-like BadF-type ATPase